MNNYQLLINKLDEFIRKYYKNELLKGCIYFVGLFVFVYLSVALFEYLGNFGIGVRTFLYYFLLISGLAILIRWIIIPVLKLNRLGKTISHRQASEIIGKHFTGIQDKLINTLQLHSLQSTGESGISDALLEASINQKIKALSPVPFTAAVDFSKNKKYLKYAAVPVFAVVVILLFSPSILTDATTRLVKHDVYFEKKSPFQFVVLNKNLSAIQQKDFELEVKLSGSEIPATVSIEIDNVEYQLSKQNTVLFSYLIKNLQKSTKFRLYADGFYSQEYELRALPNPIVLNFDVALNYPAYVGKKNETLHNTGDLVIPSGTKVTWLFTTQNTKQLNLSFSDTSIAVKQAQENSFSYNNRYFRNKTYAIVTSNEYLKSRDSILYSINVIPDVYPSIAVSEQPDSLSTKRIGFRGEVKDDYGFSKLEFKYKIISPEDSAMAKFTQNNEKTVSLAVNKLQNQDNFFHYWDISPLGILPGDQIEYYFEVWDNDGVSGAKSARTQKMLFKAPTLQQLSEATEKNNSKIKDDLQASLKKAKDIQKDMNDISKRMIEKKAVGFEEKKKIQELLDKQKELQKTVEEIQKENTKNNNEQNEYKQQDEQLAEKQAQLEKLFNELMSDEMKEKIKELQKLLENFDKEKTQEALEKMKLDNKDLEKQLDRQLELFKQLEVEQKLKDAQTKLEDLAKKQNDLAEKSKEKDADSKQLQDKQAELDKKFDEIKKDIADAEKKNSELEKPNDLQKTEQEQKAIDKEMQDAKDQLGDKKNKKASESQKKAAQQQEELAQKLDNMQKKMEQEENEEDIDALREILENLIQLSFDQEGLMKQLNTTQINNPQYVKIAQVQKKLKDDAKIIEDSLFALSKRQPKIENMVNKEIADINANMDKSIKLLAERQSPVAAARQQYVMTSVNNLALLLSEALDQMQQQQQQSKPGSGSCKKPGKNSKPSAATMQKLQKEINDQIKKLKEGMDNPNGKKDGKGKDGLTGKPQNSGQSEQLSKLAAQQEALRRELQKMAGQMDKDGKSGNGELKKIADNMEKTETDLVNKRISQETLNRQQEIMTRLLEAEKAEREREQDEKRQSNEAKIQENRNPNSFLEYNLLKQKEAELLKTVPPALNSFYKTKVNEYFNTFEK
ncbi:MAG: DUF4175 domain-containing protein [Bacteroidetes bacterium]|nr:DUF4175 domain-containing protein [Bacteroidota bacterium]